MNVRYRWVETGKTFACQCGGTVRGYVVEPRRSSAYLNHVFVCDSPACRQAGRKVLKNGDVLEGRLLIPAG